MGPGGAQGGLLPGLNNLPRHHPRSVEQAKKDRIRMGPIVFDADHLEYDDNDDYADDEAEAYERPQLGLDLSSLFLPIINFMKLTGKSFEAVFTLLEKQANLLLGKFHVPQLLKSQLAKYSTQLTKLRLLCCG